MNPATAEEIPIWVADYVLGSYGSGAIMAVPGHDTRDFEFAEAFDLAVKRVVQSPTEERPKLPYTGGYPSRIPGMRTMSEWGLDDVLSGQSQFRVGTLVIIIVSLKALYAVAERGKTKQCMLRGSKLTG